MHCFCEFTTSMYQWKFYFIRHIINLCESHSKYRKFRWKGGGVSDIRSGEKKLNKNFIYNEFTLIYPSSYIDRNWKEMSKNIVPTYSDISIDMHACNTYMICHQQAKYHLSDSIMFNISVSSVLTDVTQRTSDMRTTSGMAGDTTLGKRNICKTFRNNTIRCQIYILIYIKNTKYENNEQ